MPPRAATGRSRTAVASSSRAKASTSAPRGRPRKQPTTTHAKAFLQDDDDDDESAQSDADDVGRDDNRTRHDGSQSITGPILMDDDEEDELGLRSPVKIVEAPTVKTNRVGGGAATAKGKAVFGTARGVNTQSTHDHPDEGDDAEDVTASKRSSRQPKTKAVRVGRKPNNTAAHPRVKALAASSKAKEPAPLVDSSDEEGDVQEVDTEVEEVETTPRSAEGVSMPEEQIQHFLHGYDLDAANRLDRLRNHLTVTLESARSQMSILLSRLPMAARSLTLTDFLELHESDVKKVVGGGVDTLAGSQVDDADGWEEMKRKRPRAKEPGEEDGNKDKGKRGKTARRNAATSSPAKTSSATRQPSNRAADKKAGPSSSRPLASSGPPAPSSATFSPRLNPATRTMPAPSAATKTPARAPAAAGRASRLAKIGEQIQMYSLNGSPITGFIGPDGRLRYLPRPGADYADQDEDAAAADAAPALPPISKSTDGKSGADESTKNLQAANALASILPKQGEPSSSRALPSSPAPQRSAPFGSSLGATSSLQPRFDDDSSAALQSSSPLRPSSRAGAHFSSSLGMGLGLADESNELPDEEAYMREIIAQEEQKRREAAGRSATLQHKSSASRLMAKFGAGGGGGSGSSNGGMSSRPPSSPAPASSSSSYSARSGGGFRSSSPSKVAPISRGGASLMKPVSSSKNSTTAAAAAAAPSGGTAAASSKGASSSASGRGGKQRLSLINARGEVVPIEDIREEDVPVEQKAQLARMFQRLGMGLGIGGSPKKR